MASRQPSSFGLLLRNQRRVAGLTQEELAERAGLSARGISDLERGISAAPHEDTVRRLAEALELRGDERSRFLNVAHEVRAQSETAPSLPPSSGAERLGLGATLAGVARWKPRTPGIKYGRRVLITVLIVFLSVTLASAAVLRGFGSAATARASLPTRLVAVWGGASAKVGRFQQPYAVTVDRQNNIYVADVATNTVQKLSPAGQPLVEWGRGSASPRFDKPDALTVDGAGNVYVLDHQNAWLQKLSPAGEVLGAWAVHGNGVAVDPQGRIYLVDGGENDIHVLSAGGTPLGTDLGCTFACALLHPNGIAVDAAGRIYITDTDNYRLAQFAVDKGQLALVKVIDLTSAGFFPQANGVAVSPNGDVFVADPSDAQLLAIHAHSGLPTRWGATSSLRGVFVQPEGVAVDGAGNIYVADPGAGQVDRLSPAGRLTAVWTATGTAGVHFVNPIGMAVSPSGAVYVLEGTPNRIQELSPAGRPKAAASFGVVGDFSDLALAVDALGRVYACRSSLVGGTSLLLMLSPGLRPLGTRGVPSFLFSAACGISLDKAGNIWFAMSDGGGVLELSGAHVAAWGGMASTLLFAPRAVAVDNNGRAFVSEGNNNTVDLLGPPGTVLHRWGRFGSAPGEFYHPSGIAIDTQDRLYVADSDNNRIQILSEGGQVLGVIGKSGRAPGEFLTPTAVALDGHGNLYVLDTGNNRIEKFAPAP